MTRATTSTAVELLSCDGTVQLRVAANQRQRESGDREYVHVKVGACGIAWLSTTELRAWSDRLSALADVLETFENNGG